MFDAVLCCICKKLYPHGINKLCLNAVKVCNTQLNTVQRLFWVVFVLQQVIEVGGGWGLLRASEEHVNGASGLCAHCQGKGSFPLVG